MAAIQEFSVPDAPSFDRRSPARWVLDHIRRYPALPFIFIVTVICMASAQSLAAVFIGRAFDVIAGGGGAPALGVAALSVLGAWVAYGLCDVGNSWSLRFLAQRVERDAREELYLSLLGKSQSFHGRRQVGELMARATNDVQQLNLMIAPHAGLILEALATLVVPLIAITLISTELLLIPLLYVLGFLLSLRGYGAQLRPLADAMRARFGQLNAGLAEAISGVEVVHSFAQEPAAARRFAGDARAYRDVFVREGDVQARYLPLLFYGICLGLAFGHALLLFMRGELSVGQVITFMALFDTLRFPTLISLTTVSQVQLGLAGAERILDLINTEGDLDQNATGYNAPMRGEVRFEGVSFSYSDREMHGHADTGAANEPATGNTLHGSGNSVPLAPPPTLPPLAGGGFLPLPAPPTPLPERERGFRQHQDAESAAAPPAPRAGAGGWGDAGNSALGRDPVKTLHLQGVGALFVGIGVHIDKIEAGEQAAGEDGMGWIDTGIEHGDDDSCATGAGMRCGKAHSCGRPLFGIGAAAFADGPGATAAAL